MAAPIALEDVITGAMESLLDGLHTCEIGKVLSFDAGTGTADVQPVNKRRFQDADTGEWVFEDRPAYPNVPILLPQAGAFGLSLPVSSGDHVLLVFAQTSISEWREAEQTSEPTDAGRLTDGHPVAFLGAFAKGKAFAQASAAGAFLGHSSGNGVDVGATSVGLGAPAGRTGVATAASTAALFTALNAYATAAAAFATAAAVHGNDPLLGAALPTGAAMATAATAAATAATALVALAVPMLASNFSANVKAGL